MHDQAVTLLTGVHHPVGLFRILDPDPEQFCEPCVGLNLFRLPLDGCFVQLGRFVKPRRAFGATACEVGQFRVVPGCSLEDLHVRLGDGEPFQVDRQRDEPSPQVSPAAVQADALLEHGNQPRAVLVGLRLLLQHPGVLDHAVDVARPVNHVPLEVVFGLAELAVTLGLLGPIEQPSGVALDLHAVQGVNADPEDDRAKDQSK